MADRNVKILGIAGSTRDGSFNRMALAAAAQQLPSGSTLEVFELHEMPLYAQQHETPLPAEVSDLKAAVEGADAILFATPEHNASISAALKSAIDWGSRPMGHNSWAGKVGAVIGASPGALGTVRAQGQLRQIMAALDMVVVSQPDVLIGSARDKFGMNGSLVDEKARALLGQLMTRLVATARALRQGAAQ
ncbi:NADPH-dependent FMN reductase [Azohydromonas australica]|uniref:NADPH-dependent FMN reductase n=1 Tax=Azohydromonas australica TaxID=364039 RepID=UPI000410522B|nr:NAD(P)H-dependent oxidoreductase [Azohydromonas australica]